LRGDLACNAINGDLQKMQKMQRFLMAQKHGLIAIYPKQGDLLQLCILLTCRIVNRIIRLYNSTFVLFFQGVIEVTPSLEGASRSEGVEPTSTLPQT
jgi:hypothetical protein